MVEISLCLVRRTVEVGTPGRKWRKGYHVIISALKVKVENRQWSNYKRDNAIMTSARYSPPSFILEHNVASSAADECSLSDGNPTAKTKVLPSVGLYVSTGRNELKGSLRKSVTLRRGDKRRDRRLDSIKRKGVYFQYDKDCQCRCTFLSSTVNKSGSLVNISGSDESNVRVISDTSSPLNDSYATCGRETFPCVFSNNSCAFQGTCNCGDSSVATKRRNNCVRACVQCIRNFAMINGDFFLEKMTPNLLLDSVTPDVFHDRSAVGINGNVWEQAERNQHSNVLKDGVLPRISCCSNVEAGCVRASRDLYTTPLTHTHLFDRHPTVIPVEQLPTVSTVAHADCVSCCHCCVGQHLPYGSRVLPDEQDVRRHVDFIVERLVDENSVSLQVTSVDNLKQLGDTNVVHRNKNVDPFMEFFSVDEHFQEFERVVQTFDHKFSVERDCNALDRLPKEEDSFIDSVHGDMDALNPPHVDETFADFFHNDEDFIQFELELDRFNMVQKCQFIEVSHHSLSSCSFLEDMMSFREKSLIKQYETVRCLSCVGSAPAVLWNSAHEWDMVLKKLERNSLLCSDPVICRLLQFYNLGCNGNNVSSNCANSVSLSNCNEMYSQRQSDCQYTCHLNCVPSVTLDCTTVSAGCSNIHTVASVDFPSPTVSEETSLIERATLSHHQRAGEHNHLITHHPCVISDAASHSSAPRIACSSCFLTGTNVSSGLKNPVTCSTTVASQAITMSFPSNACLVTCTNVDNDESTKDLGGVSSAGHSGDANLIKHGFPVDSMKGVEDTVENSTEKDETDSGYRSGTIPDDNLPKASVRDTLSRTELQRKVETFNYFVPKAALEVEEDGKSFQGFMCVTLNLIRPITMELGARPPSIYELLTREHIVEQSTQHVAFYMPRDTVKSIHITSNTTTRELIIGLLKKFHILDHPRKFALYSQEFNERNKLVKLIRLADKHFPLLTMLTWNPERIRYYRLVLQENETGEIVARKEMASGTEAMSHLLVPSVLDEIYTASALGGSDWDAFSVPELKNFLIVLDREENEAIAQLEYKYRVMKRIIQQRLKELRKEQLTLNESYA